MISYRDSDTAATPSQAFDGSGSTMDSFANAGGSRPRYDSNQLLTLPAPLALSRPATNGGSSTSVARSSDSDNSSSQQRLVYSPASNTTEQLEDYYGASPSGPSRQGRGNQDYRSSTGTMRQATSPTPFPGAGEATNPFQSKHDNHYSAEHDAGPSLSPTPSGGQRRARGVSLSDNGPVPGPDGVRRVSRPPSRRTSQTPQQNRYSRTTSLYSNLPPGAAPPNPNSG
jgi:chitin synthase